MTGTSISSRLVRVDVTGYRQSSELGVAVTKHCLHSGGSFTFAQRKLRSIWQALNAVIACAMEFGNPHGNPVSDSAVRFHLRNRAWPEDARPSGHVFVTMHIFYSVG